MDELNRIIILPLLTDLIESSVLSICDDCWVFLCDHRCIPVSLPPFHCALWSAFVFARLCSCSHYAYRISLRSVKDTTPEGILSSCGCSLTVTLTTLNMHMVGCGYHEILIQRSVTALFLTNFSLYPIRLWFWWLSYSNHSFQLLSNQYSVHHSDSARDHQSCNQKQFIATSYWRQAHIQSHLSCCNWNKAREFIAIDSAQNSHSLAKSKALAVSEISESYLFNNS